MWGYMFDSKLEYPLTHLYLARNLYLSHMSG